MITLKPLTWDIEQFLTELDIEITFMRLHNPDDELEIVLSENTYNFIPRCVLKAYDLPVRIDNTMLDRTVDVRLKNANNTRF